MTREEIEEAIFYFKEWIKRDSEMDDVDRLENIEIYKRAIKALNMLEEFENAQIITGGRLNGRTYAYKCGLENGERKALEQEPRKGHWLRMSDLSEQDDDRYKCSCCGNVVHYANKANLYTFNSWCGRCGSDNGRLNYEVEVMTREEIEKLPVILDMLLSEGLTEHTNEKIHEKITEVCNLAIKALDMIEESEMRKLVRESDVIDKTDGSELARAFNYLWDKYVDWNK